ncbi:MAG TPA: FtsX-like permease family protein [Vicinamibacterales bacterium]|nr:FtsX-like permease family protein [Vicinamibacterales bacterium]
MFILRHSLRELRASWRRLLFFFLCVAIGVGAIVTLRSIIQSLRAGLMSEARTMIASDVIVQTNRAWTPEVRGRVDAILAQAPIVARTESIETPTMVRAEGGAAVARMVELRAVEPAFPFYGTVAIAGGQPYSHALLEQHGALVGPELLVQLNVAVGDRLMIAGQPFTIRGVIEKEPGRRLGAFSLGPRVLIDREDLIASGLLTFGSRASYQLLLKVEPAGVQRLTDRLRNDLRGDFVGARSYLALEDDIGEDLQRAENYLSLVGFVIVVLGGIGVWSVTRVFVRQKIKSVAILKCLGATTGQVLATYVAQVACLALAGSLVGVGLAEAAMRSIPASLAATFGGVSYGLTSSAVVQGLAVGLLVSLLFALVPLLEVRRVKPLLLLRGSELAAVRGTFWSRIDWLQVATAVLVSAGLVAVASWQAASVRAGALVSGGFAGVAVVLYAAAWALVRLTAPLARTSWFPMRHAVLGLRRPGNQTRVILLSVGLGCFFVMGVRTLQQNLIDEAVIDVDEGAADLFVVDIQRDQVDGVRSLLHGWQGGGAPARLVPTLRARVTGVRGRDLNLDGYADVRGRGSLAREYTVTYRPHVEQNEEIIDGAAWPETTLADGSQQEVSIEQSIHERFRINVGDVMRFDVAGRPLEARVVSVRRVRWEDSRSGGFMFVFRPGILEKAPHTYVAFVRGPADATARAKLQYELVSRYPNITAVDAREVLARIRAVVDNIVLAISVVGGVALASGILILIGAVAMTKFQRVYEAAILRTLGASTRLLGAMVAIEYSALGLIAGVIGAAGALALSWAVTKYLLEIAWRPQPLLLSAGVALTALLVAIVGVVASSDVLRRKPLGALRAE